MANFKVTAQYPTVEFFGGSQSRQVVAVGCTSIPHGVYFEVLVPRTGYSAAAVAAAASPVAAKVEGLFTVPGVTGVQWSQRQLDNGGLGEELIVTVASSSGNSKATEGFLIRNIGPLFEAALIGALRAHLDAAEAL